MVWKLLRAGTVALILVVAAFCVRTWLDNRAVPPVERGQLELALQHAIGWLETNRTAALSDPNPTLWWMLARADEVLGGDARLQSMIAEYGTKWMHAGTPVYPWYPMFDRRAGTTASAGANASLPTYNLYFMYALTCDELLGQLDVITMQNDASYCSGVWIVHAHCRSHQLMGLLWALDRGCPGVTREAAIEVRNAMWHEELLDFRVDDTYIQRALLLAFERSTTTPLKSVWVARILDHQLWNGGWDGDYEIVPIGSNHYVMAGPGGVGIRRQAASLHSTAQGILLLARLLHDTPKKEASRLAQWASLEGG